MSSSEDELFFGKPTRWWHRTSKVNGIKAVIQRWGNPSDITDGMTKADMLTLTLRAVDDFVPELDFDNVTALIARTDPPAQQPEPRSQQPRAAQTGIKTVKRNVRPEARLPQELIRGFTPVNPTVLLEFPESGLEGEPGECEQDEGSEEDPAEGPDLRDTSGTFNITVARPDTGGQVIPTSTQLLQQDLIDSLRTFIIRNFHCHPKLATDRNPTLVPKRPVEAFDNRTALARLSLEDLFNNTDDPCMTFLKLYANGRTYRPHPSGNPHPYCGRGPVWSNNSSPMDCCIVAARLLQLGLTQADSRDEQNSGWTSTLHPFHQDCLQIFHEQ